MNKPGDFFALKLLRLFCPSELYEEIEGDLIQRFNRDVKASDLYKCSEDYRYRRARRRLMWKTLKFFRPGIVFRNQFKWRPKPFFMFSHYFKIFIRSTWRSKGYSFINVSGLAIGMVCSIFALLWIMDEFAYDAFHKDKERIFAFRTNSKNTDGIFTFNATSGRLAEGLKEFPEVEESARASFRLENGILFNYKDKSFYEAGVYADPSLLTIFTFPVIEGDRRNPLPDANSAAITRKLAKKYFGDESAIGKIIRVNNETDVRVTVVLEDIPTPSTIQFQILLPYSIYKKTDPYNEEWGAWTGGNTYVKLRKGVDQQELEAKISKQITHPKIWPRWGDTVEHVLLPLTAWHLRSNFENGKQSGGRIAYVIGFGCIAGFILLIACVNFMNLATARSLSRAKEIGIRKVVGALRQSLANQFLNESIFIAILSLIVALGLVHLLLPYFNELTNKKIFIDYSNVILISSLAAITLFTGMIAGSYPAFFLSSLRAIQVLKDKLSGGSSANVRKTLVVFQFSLSVILVTCALVVYRQLEYMREKDLGFDKENAFYIQASDRLNKNFEEFKRAVANHPGIVTVTRSAEVPMNIQNGLELADDGWRGKTKQDNVAFQWLKCDEDFLRAFKFDFIEGRNFSAALPADSSNFIINEEAARQMHFDSPLGETLKVIRKGTIIGVLKNFHGTGLNQPIQPVIISMSPKDANRFFIQYEKGQLTQTMDHVQSVYKKLEPDFPLDYTFLDDTFNSQYENEILIGKLSTCFMVIAVFISCLGLFGLSSFTAERRVKEIGIRKILGATVSQLVSMLCRDFVVLVGIALAIGFPISWWLGNQFLQSYAFRTEISVSVFILTGFSLLVIALLTVSFQSARAAMYNPVKSLRTE